MATAASWPSTGANAAFTADPQALDLLSVRYLVVTDKDTVARQAMASRYPLAFHDEVAGVSVFRNPGSLPRVRLTPALAPGPVPINDAGQLELSPSVSYSTDPALVAAAAKAGIPTHSSDTIPASSSRITDDGSTQVTVAVDTPKSSVLVLADSYHSGWSATVDGRPAHLGVVDGVLRGVVVPRRAFGGGVPIPQHRLHRRVVGVGVGRAGPAVRLWGVGVAAPVPGRNGRATPRRCRVRDAGHPGGLDHPPIARITADHPVKEPLVMAYQFLTQEWIDEAKRLQDEAGPPATPAGPHGAHEPGHHRRALRRRRGPRLHGHLRAAS